MVFSREEATYQLSGASCGFLRDPLLDEGKGPVLGAVSMDNVAAVWYVNHLGGTKSKVLADLTTQFWEYCLAY